MNNFPETFDQMQAWAQQAEVPVRDARNRFAQFIILEALATQPRFREQAVFKGGNALDFVLQPNRSTIDLDFSLRMVATQTILHAETLKPLIETSLLRASQRHDVEMQLNSLRQRPPGPGRTYFALEARIGFALCDEPALRRRMRRGIASSQVIPVEISAHDVVCAISVRRIGATGATLYVATLEDIVAEKLRALLQQPIRNRQRRQDLLDIAVLVRLGHDLDFDAIGRFLIVKSEARGINARRSAFDNPDIRRRAAIDYDRLEETTRVLFIPFDEAWAILRELVQTLPIPE